MQAIRQHYEKISPKDRRALLLLVCFLAVVGGFFLWRSIDEAVMQARHDYQTASADLVWMMAHQADNPRNTIPTQEGPLLPLLAKAAEQENLLFSRIEPAGDNSVHLWFEKISFNALVGWLDRLQREQGLRVKEISVTRGQEEGDVDANLVLSR